MLPHLEGRPVTLHRWPDGIEGDDFFQQARPDHLPNWVGAATLSRKGGGEVTHPVADDVSSLLALVETGCLTPHIWLARADRPDRPDRMVFDLDPPDRSEFGVVRSAALELRTLLDDIGLVALAMVTGSRGVHVVAPLRRDAGFDRVREVAREIAGALVDRRPDERTLEQRVGARGGRLYVDIMRNAYGQHVVAPYAVRARPGAPVATPVDWHELESGNVGPESWSLASVVRRLGQKDDPWMGAWRRARSVERAASGLAAG
jgi:bifunctional non-homologous end joining protein LigD